MKSGSTTHSSLSPLPETRAGTSSHTSSLWTSFTYGWFGASQGTQEKSQTSNESRSDVVNQTTEPDEKKRKQDLRISELSEHYREHTKRQLSQLPLVGLGGNQGSKFNGFVSKLVRKTQGMLSTLEEAHHHTAAGNQSLGISDEVGHYLVEGCEGLSDLSCIGMALYDLSPLPDEFNFVFNIGSMNDTREPSLYPLVGVYRRDSTGVLDSLISSLGLNHTTRNIVHTFDQILGLDFEPEWTLVNQANLTLNYWSAQVLVFISNSLDIDKGRLSGSLALRHSATQTEPKVKATVTDNLSDWELFVQEQSCLVYRKPYGNKGLSQFRVVGTYSDVTAKDFYEVQVCS